MPRKPRAFTAAGVYHVVTRGNNRQYLFKKRDDFVFFLALLTRLKAELSFDLYHYCLMSNHTHLLMKIHDSEALQKIMQRANLT